MSATGRPEKGGAVRWGKRHRPSLIDSHVKRLVSEAAEKALRDAADEVAGMEWDERPHEIADWLRWRADDLAARAAQ